MNRTQTFKN